MKGFKASLASAVKLSAIGAAVAVCLSPGAYARATADQPRTPLRSQPVTA